MMLATQVRSVWWTAVYNYVESSKFRFPFLIIFNPCFFSALPSLRYVARQADDALSRSFRLRR